MKSIAYLGAKEKYEDVRQREIRKDFWGGLSIEGQRALKKLLETSMAIEVQDLIGSGYWEHNLKRANYRNGYYYRDLLTSIGNRGLEN